MNTEFQYKNDTYHQLTKAREETKKAWKSLMIMSEGDLEDLPPTWRIKHYETFVACAKKEQALETLWRSL